MIQNYKAFQESHELFENLEKAKKMMADLKLPLTDPKFLQLKELLKNNLGYMGPFTKWYIEDREDWVKIDDTFKLLKNIKIDRPIESFKKLEDLYDYIQQFEINKKVNQIISALPSYSQENVSEGLRNLLKLNIEWEDHIKNFYHNKGGR